MSRYSIASLIRNGFSYHENWRAAWRSPEPKAEYDAVIVGGGGHGLATAYYLAKEHGITNVAVLEKAEALGQHSLSGAVVDPRAFRELFPDLKDADFPFRAPVGKERVYVLTERRALRIPTPPPMHNHGNYVVSLGDVVGSIIRSQEDTIHQLENYISGDDYPARVLAR